MFEVLGIKNWIWYGKKTIRFYDYRNFNVDEFKKFYKKFISVYYKIKKTVNMTESEYFETFCYYFMSGVRGNIGCGQFKQAHELGYQFADTKFF